MSRYLFQAPFLVYYYNNKIIIYKILTCFFIYMGRGIFIYVGMHILNPRNKSTDLSVVSDSYFVPSLRISSGMHRENMITKSSFLVLAVDTRMQEIRCSLGEPSVIINNDDIWQYQTGNHTPGKRRSYMRRSNVSICPLRELFIFLRSVALTDKWPVWRRRLCNSATDASQDRRYEWNFSSEEHQHCCLNNWVKDWLHAHVDKDKRSISAMLNQIMCVLRTGQQG